MTLATFCMIERYGFEEVSKQENWIKVAGDEMKMVKKNHKRKPVLSLSLSFEEKDVCVQAITLPNFTHYCCTLQKNKKHSSYMIIKEYRSESKW